MATLLLGIAALVVGLWLIGVFARIDAKAFSRGLKLAGGLAALAGSALLAIRGQFGLALPLGAAGLGLLGWLPLAAGLGARTQKSPGQVSRVRSAFLDMELDLDTGAMRGRILAGPHEGVSLDALDVPALIELLPHIDEESRALLATYLDRRDASWREHAQGDSATGRGSPPSGGPMTQEEAYQILGLQPGAGPSDVRRAHRTLMKKLHPDQGGSTYLAARVNQAKDVLLRQHR